MNEIVTLSLVIVGILLVLLGTLRLRNASGQDMVFGLIGAIVGLMLGALASVPISKLPQPFGSILPLIVSLILTFAVMAAVLSRRASILHYLPFLRLPEPSATAPSNDGVIKVNSTSQQILVDTSAIIDGRIADIAAAGFVPGTLIVPRFVLAELQNIADSEDAMRRGRGRRGLEVLNRLRETQDVTVEVTDEDVSAIKEVDAKLVALAQRHLCNVLTTDYNLNRVAAIQGVRVLNVNELSNAIRPVVLPGEELVVRVVQPGKERNQGVGYLADGTMIVVENGDKMIGQEVSTEVTRVFQTVAGKMIFAVPRKGDVLPEALISAKPDSDEAAVTQATKNIGEAIPATRESQRERLPKSARADIKERNFKSTTANPEVLHELVAPEAKIDGTEETGSSIRSNGRSHNASVRHKDDRRRQHHVSSLEDRLVQENNAQVTNQGTRIH